MSEFARVAALVAVGVAGCVTVSPHQDDQFRQQQMANAATLEAQIATELTNQAIQAALLNMMLTQPPMVPAPMP